MKYIFKISVLLFIVAILFVFRNWFMSFPVMGGDFSLNWISIKDIGLYPYSWFSSGLGYNASFLLYGYSLNIILFVLANITGLSLAENILYFYSLIVFSFFCSGYVFRKIFNGSVFWILSSFLFTVNTYILMVVGGGQMGVALSYSITHLVLYRFIKLIDSGNIKNSLIAALILSLQLVFDLRIAYVTLVAVLIYWLIKLSGNLNIKHFLRSALFTIIIPGIISLFVNLFWILPIVSSGQNPIQQLGAAYSTGGAVKYFSFANFENAIGLLHPNWPENVFGKVSFMRPEFLLLPLFAFISLFFVLKIKDRAIKNYVLFFALIGLIGVFLAKGANEPFGVIYLWMFDHIPGFNLFRDPTKWYTLIAVSYSILIPFGIWKTYEFIKSGLKFSIKNTVFNLQNLFLILTSLFLILLISPALLGQLTGTFKTSFIPGDYIKLEQILSSQNSFSRTFWVPTIQRFGFSSYNHPAISAADLFQVSDTQQIIKKLMSQDTEKLLQESGVKYVVVPYDSQGEIFLKDRKYNNQLYLQTINQVKSIPWLKEEEKLNRVVLFQVPNPKEHFWSNSKALVLQSQYISPVEYRIDVGNARKGDLIIFSESYDAKWYARDINDKFYDWPNLIGSDPYNRLFNSFILRKDGNYTLDIYYYPQILVNVGLFISVASLFIVLGSLAFILKRK